MNAATRPAPTAIRPAGARFGRLLLRLLVVVTAFAALPLALHEPFRRADAQHRAMLLRAAQDQATVIVAALAPLFDRSDPRAVERINAAAQAFTADGTTLRIVHAPRAIDSALLVAAFPPVADRDFAVIRARLRQAEGAGLDRARCTGSGTLESRIATVDGGTEILGAAAMHGTAEDCWTVLIGWRSASHLESSLGRPFWATDEMRLAGIGYALLLALVLAMLVRGWRDTRALGRIEALAQRRAAGEPPAPLAPPPAPAPPSVLSAAQESSTVATLRAAAAASGAATSPAAAAAPAARQDRPEVELRKQVADRVFDLHDACTRNGLSLSYEALHPVRVLASAQQVDGIVDPLLQRALNASRAGDVLRVALRIGETDARVHIEDAGRNASGAVTDDMDPDPIVIEARRDLEALGGALDMFRLENGGLRVTARFPRAETDEVVAPESEAEA